MKKILLIILFTLSLFAQQPQAAKDPVVDGGLWIIGPDISPDSLGGQLLFYTPDAGTTMYHVDTLDYYDYSRNCAIAADCCSANVLYKIPYLGLTVSFDGGHTWEDRHDGLSPTSIQTGKEPGCIMISYRQFFINYCLDVHNGSLNGIDTGDRGAFWFERGWEPGSVIFINGRNKLIAGKNYADTLYYVNDSIYFDKLIAAHEPHSMWVMKGGVWQGGDSLFYSTDFCSTYTFKSVLPRHGIAGSCWQPHTYIRGNNPGELFLVYIRYNHIPLVGVQGGWIIIYYSNDYGETFSCVSHPPSAGAVEESEHVDRIEKFYEECNGKIYSNEILNLYDIRGNLIRKSNNIDTKEYPTGLYLISNGKQTGKIVNIK